MSDYPKYRKKGDIHWKWYLGGNVWYTCLVNESVAQFRGLRGTLLDVGCGDGLSSYILSCRGFRVMGIDSEPKGIEIATERMKYLKFKGQVTTAEDYVKECGEFDYLYSLNTIEHLEDPTVFVGLMKKVKEFGIIVTDNGAVRKGKHPYHTMEFTKETLAELFKDFKTEPFEFSDAGTNKHFIGIKVWSV
ncbi:hypothetical protein LCGC14_2829340 [marine sediment metagenome]|uniref:Methyltransferase type 11 domain-containing protein n=1 Tax=marine sediment metagenome TaxID=412755 RepID=A0A0F8YEL3_9ZZZZ|nr:methyltransferase domain-containing protein [bacterium]